MYDLKLDRHFSHKVEPSSYLSRVLQKNRSIGSLEVQPSLMFAKLCMGKPYDSLLVHFHQ